MARKNENSVAAVRESPKSMPPMIVAPERDVPGLRVAVSEDTRCDRKKLRPVFPTDGEYRAGLDDDLEELRFFAGVVEERPGDDQMSGAGDRKELRYALDDAEDRSSEQVGVGHRE